MPPSITDAHNRAQILHRKGDHSGAIKALTAILSKWSDKTHLPLMVLDTRAAALIRLKKYDEALQDARAMITSDKTISSGYLRAGQILRKQGLGKKAVKIYELGMKEVIDSAALAVIKKELNEVKKGIVPDGARDWIMTVLPAEILELILKRLEFREFVQLQLVCRKWRDVFRSMPRMWRELELGRKKDIKHKTLEAYGKRAQWTVTSLLLKRTTPGTLKMMVHKCRFLKTLRYAAYPEDHISSVLRTCSAAGSLQHIDLPLGTVPVDDALKFICEMPMLKSFHGSVITSKTVRSSETRYRIPANLETLTLLKNDGPLRIDTLFTDTINLVELSLAKIDCHTLNLRHMQRLRTLRIFGELCYEQGVYLPPSLEVLAMKEVQCKNPAVFLEQKDDISPNSFPKLRSLSIEGRQTAPMKDELIGQCGRELRKLVMFEAWGRPWSLFKERALRREFQELESLELGNGDFEDLCFIECAHLQSISIYHNSAITGSSIIRLAENAPNLRSVDVINCPGIKLDVGTWLKDRGIRTRLENSY